MKKYLPTLLGIVLLIGLALPALGATFGKTVDARGGIDVGNTLCYSVLSADGNIGPDGRQAVPTVTFLNATSDKAGSIVQFYTTDTMTSANYASSTVSVPVARTNGFAASDVIVIRHKATDTYERRILAAFTSATNLTTTVALTTATAVGDQIWKVTAAGSIPVGNATISLTGPGIYSGEAGEPLLLEVDGTSACQINAVCAEYK